MLISLEDHRLRLRNVYKYAYERYSSVKRAEKFTKIINEVLLK